jgi:DNA-binding SARP family transcriptional activator
MDARPWTARQQLDTWPWPETPHFQLGLLNGFRLFRDGDPLTVPGAAQRLLAMLSLHRGPARRSYTAGMLWLDVPDKRAAGSLRSALWRLRQTAPELVVVNGTELMLGSCVDVDYLETRALALDIVEHASSSSPAAAASPEELAFDLLPDSPEEWVVIEREQFRQLRLHALEVLSGWLSAAGRHGEAVRAGLLAVSGEPLRESAQRALITAFLAEGNEFEAVRQFASYRRLLGEELGVEPSPRARELVRGLTSDRSATTPRRPTGP